MLDGIPTSTIYNLPFELQLFYTIFLDESFYLFITSLLAWRMQFRGNFDGIFYQFWHYVPLHLSVGKERGVYIYFDQVRVELVIEHKVETK